MRPSSTDEQRRDEVLGRIREAVCNNQVIRLPRTAALEGREPLLAMATAEDAYGGGCGDYRYLFEGEDDLLHVVVMRADGAPCSAEEAQRVIAWLLPDVPPGLIWIKPGSQTQHFYLGHDILVPHPQPPPYEGESQDLP